MVILHPCAAPSAPVHGSRLGEEEPPSTLLGLHWRHGDIGAVLHWLVGRRLRRLVGFVADLCVCRFIFRRLIRREEEESVKTMEVAHRLTILPYSTLTLKWAI